MPTQPAADRPRIAVIGAGLAGLTCAAALAEAGHTPVVFEKSRGIGGRMATRRADPLAFDHGAQYITARGAGFEAFLRRAAERGLAARWPEAEDGGHPRWVGTPRMNAPLRPLAEGLDIRLGTRVTALERDPEGWSLSFEDSPEDTPGDTPTEGPFARVVLAVPAPQAAALLAAPMPDLADALGAVTVAPCWALMAAFDLPPGGLADTERDSRADLAWIARNGSKPGREGPAQTWVAHAGPDWSTAHLELDRDRALAALLDLLAALNGAALPTPTHAAAHRWRHAMTLRPLGTPCLASADGSLCVGGDWALGATCETAWESGRAMAGTVLAGL